jgi:hypothetical protein
MRDFRDVDDIELRAARPMRLGRQLLANMVTGALFLVAIGVLFGVYSVAVNHF